MSKLSVLLSVEKSTTTRLVEPFIAKGYLKKRKASHDMSIMELHIMQTGKKTCEKVWSCINDFMVSMDASIPGDKKEDVLQALEIFTNSIEHCCTIQQ